MMAELVAQSHLPPPKDRSVARGMALGTVTPTLLESFKRLTDLLDEPDAIEVLAPLVQREIHYRLLTSDQAGRLRQLASVGSQSHLVARAIEWLKANYAAPLRIEELAERVHMSASSLHHHFRQLTAMSPLQYQKWLRLNEARRLMLNDGLDAAAPRSRSATKARRSSAASTPDSSARHPNATWPPCGARPRPPDVRSARFLRRVVAQRSQTSASCTTSRSSRTSSRGCTSRTPHSRRSWPPTSKRTTSSSRITCRHSTVFLRGSLAPP